ncbi:MAG: hypothetical protein WD845_10340 [Pirellulales bacterium]
MHKTTALVLTLAGALPCLTLAGCGRSAAAGPRPSAEAVKLIREKLAGGDAAEAGQQAAEATGTGWGTLKGTFKYVGTPPAPGVINADKDTEVCGKEGPLIDNSLVVSSGGGIANVVVYARAKRVHDSAKPLEAGQGSPVIFDQKNCMFLTHVTAMQVGQPLDIKNSDPIGHNTKIDPRSGVPFNQNLPTGETVAYIPTAEEALPAGVSCSIHPWMRAYLLPRKDKYFAVTNDDGSFEIANLPAGEDLEIQVWHERGTGPSGALVLDRKELKWTSKGRFKVKLEPDVATELTFDVPGAAFK